MAGFLPRRGFCAGLDESMAVWLRDEKGPVCSLHSFPTGPHQEAEAGGRQSGVCLSWRLVHGALVLVQHPGKKEEGEKAECGCGGGRDNWKASNQAGLGNKTPPDTLHTFADEDIRLQVRPSLFPNTFSSLGHRGHRNLFCLLMGLEQPPATYLHPRKE